MDSQQGDVSVRIIHVSGKSAQFSIPSDSCVSDIIQTVFDNWPAEFDERVSSPSLLKLIYQGRFLHGSVCLHALHLHVGHSVAMHIVPRETLPQPDSREDVSKRKRHRCCRCSVS